eukprot:Hpha_TRINITY_DN15415_c1_g1::TRINITY_DN15415_c1_g1_i1::g.175460::m.175460
MVPAGGGGGGQAEPGKRISGVTEFKDLAKSLQANRQSSFANDAAVRNSLSSRAKSFITAQDVADTPSATPARSVGGVAQSSVSSLSESLALGLADGALNEDDWLLGQHYLCPTAYECLLLSYPQLIPHLAGREVTEPPPPELARIEEVRARLGVSDAEAAQVVAGLERVLGTDYGETDCGSVMLQLSLLADSVQHSQPVEEPPAASGEPMESTADPPLGIEVASAEYRHLAVFACAMHLALRRAQRGDGGREPLKDEEASRMLAKLFTDTRSVSQRILMHRRNPTPEALASITDLLRDMKVSYAQFPFTSAIPVTITTATATASRHFHGVTPSRHSSSSGRGSPTEAAFANNHIASADDLVLMAEEKVEGNAVLPMEPPSASTADIATKLQLLSISGDQAAEEGGSTAVDTKSLQGLNGFERRATGEKPVRPVSGGSSLRPMSVNTAGGESTAPPPPEFMPLCQDTDGVLIATASDLGDEVPAGVTEYGTGGYGYPLNIIIYATLLRTFLVESPEDAATAAAEAGRRGQAFGVLRSRRQETRMKQVVDLLAPFRVCFQVSSFLHAACFVHAIFTEMQETKLDFAEVFRLLSVDCYFYPGFKSFCSSKNLAPDEEACRRQVLMNMRDDLLPRLADYHCEFVNDPGDLIFCIKLYTAVLEAFHEQRIELATLPSENAPDDAAAMFARQNIRRRRSGDRESDVQVGSQQGHVRRQLRFAEDVPMQRRRGSASNSARPASAPAQLRELAPSASGGEEEEEKDASVSQGMGLQRSLMALGGLFGADVASCVREVMLSGGVEEAGEAELAIYTYAEILALIISSCHKHYIRVKHKVAMRSDEGQTKMSKEDAPFGDWGVWLAQLTSSQPLTRGQDARGGPGRSVSHSISSSLCVLPDNGRAAAERLVPRRETGSNNPLTMGRPTLSQISAQLRLDMNQAWRLVEVLLLELHADTRHYGPSLVCVVPSAVSVVLNTYTQLLARDITASADSITVAPASRPSCDTQQPIVDSASVTPQLSPVNGDKPNASSSGSSGKLPQSRAALPVVSPSSPGGTVSVSDARIRVPSAQTASPGLISEASATPPSLHPTATNGNGPSLMPRRSSSPHLPGSFNSRREVQAHTRIPADDEVGLSLLNTNVVYAALLLTLLMQNLRSYVAFSRTSRADFSLLSQQYSAASGRDSAYWLAGLPLQRVEEAPRPASEGRGGGWSCIGDTTTETRRHHHAVSQAREAQAGGTRATSLRLLRRRQQQAGVESDTHVQAPHSAPSGGQRPGHRSSPDHRGPRLDGRSVSPEFPGSSVWDDRGAVGNGSGTAGAWVKDTIAPTITGVVDKLGKLWRTIADATLEDGVERALDTDSWEPVGTLHEEVVSSSAVDTSLVAHRVTLLVEHGIENAWEMLKMMKATLQVHPLGPEANWEQSLCERFTSACEDVLSNFEEQSKQLVNGAYRRYAEALIAPLAPLRQDTGPAIASGTSVAPIDPRLLRHRHRQLFEDPVSGSFKSAAMRANNLLHCRSRLEEILQHVVSRYSLVAWRKLQNDATPTDAAGQGAESAAAQEGRPTLVLAKAGGLDLGPSPRSPTPLRTVHNVLSQETAAFADEAVGQVLMFMATKAVVFDAADELKSLYTSVSQGIETVLVPLGQRLHEVTASLLPAHRKPFCRFVLGTLSQSVTAKLARGKMARPPTGRFAFFQQLVDDLHGLREFFLHRDAEGTPQMLTESQVEAMTACVLSAILLFLSKNPTEIILQQGGGDTLPHHLTYTKPQIHGMVEQIAGRSPAMHQFLLEALEVQRINEVQSAWDEQRATLLSEPTAVEADERDQSERRGGGGDMSTRGGTERKGTDKKKPTKSRLCSVQ